MQLTSGRVFTAYSVEHWVALLLIAAPVVVLTMILRRSQETEAHARIRRLTCGALIAALLVGTVFAEGYRVATGIWSAQESLPLHLCDIAVFVAILALAGAGWRGGAARGVWQWCYELAYVWGIGGTSQAILTPDLGEGFPHPLCVSYFFLHGGIVVSVLVMTIGLRMRPQRGAVRRVWVATLVLALVMMPINWLLGANYMYLCGPPARPTLIDWLGPWPWSLVPLAGVGTVLIVLSCAPFWLVDRWRGRRVSVGAAQRVTSEQCAAERGR